MENCSDNFTENSSSVQNSKESCIKCSTLKIITKFESYINKKIPSLINKNILVINSGTLAVPALLHLLQIRFQEILKVHSSTIYCLYINDEIRNDSKNEKFEDLFFNEKKLGFKNCVASLSSFFVHKKVLIEDPNEFSQNKNSKEIQILKKFFTILQDESTKQDLKFKLYEKLILNAAVKLNCNVVMFADLASDFAKEIVQNIVTGRCLINSVNDNSENTHAFHLKVLHPLRDCYNEEILTYLKFYKHNTFEQNGISIKNYKNSSIQDITENFIVKLSVNSQFISAIICKLYKKVTPKNFQKLEHVKNIQKCSLCYRVVKFNVNSSKPSTEILKWFSNYISKKSISESEIKSMLDSHSTEKFKFIPAQVFFDTSVIHAKSKTFSTKNKSDSIYICYSCSLFFQDQHAVQLHRLLK